MDGIPTDDLESITGVDMSQERSQLGAGLADATAAPVFWLALLFLANTAALIVLWVDVARVREVYLSAMEESGDAAAMARVQASSL